MGKLWVERYDEESGRCLVRGEDGQRHSARCEPTGKYEADMTGLYHPKKDKVAVSYRMAESDSAERCSTCKFYYSRVCNLVEGEIDPAGLCDLYEVRAYEGEKRQQSERRTKMETHTYSNPGEEVVRRARAYAMDHNLKWPADSGEAMNRVLKEDPQLARQYKLASRDDGGRAGEKERAKLHQLAKTYQSEHSGTDYRTAFKTVTRDYQGGDRLGELYNELVEMAGDEIREGSETFLQVIGRLLRRKGLSERIAGAYLDNLVEERITTMGLPKTEAGLKIARSEIMLTLPAEIRTALQGGNLTLDGLKRIWLALDKYN